MTTEGTDHDVKEQKRLKRLDQLALAREKALTMKKTWSAPKKELKKLESEIKEKLYQEDLKRVKNLREIALDKQKSEDAPVVPSTPRRAPMSSSKTFEEDPAHDRFTQHCNHLENLINILYS